MSFRPDPGMLSASRFEAPSTSYFHVLIGTQPLGDYRSVTGFGHTNEVESYREGGRNWAPHQLWAGSGTSTCKIQAGYSFVPTLYDWVKAVEAGSTFRRHVTIIQLRGDMVPIKAYMLWNAWPVRWSGAELNADASMVDTEDIELAYDAVFMVPLPMLPVMEWTSGTGTPYTGLFPYQTSVYHPRVDVTRTYVRGVRSGVPVVYVRRYTSRPSTAWDWRRQGDWRFSERTYPYSYAPRRPWKPYSRATAVVSVAGPYPSAFAPSPVVVYPVVYPDVGSVRVGRTRYRR